MIQRVKASEEMGVYNGRCPFCNKINIGQYADICSHFKGLGHSVYGQPEFIFESNGESEDKIEDFGELYGDVPFVPTPDHTKDGDGIIPETGHSHAHWRMSADEFLDKMEKWINKLFEE